MHLCFEQEQRKNGRRIEVRGFNSRTTVADFLEANSHFLGEHPLPCFDCSDNCCRRGWNIELDIVFVNRWCLKNRLAVSEFYSRFISLNGFGSPVFKQEVCSFLDKEGKCQIYSLRPFICRAYTCFQEGPSYQVLRDIVVRSLGLLLLNKLWVAADSGNVSLQREQRPIRENLLYLEEKLVLPREEFLEQKDYSVKISLLFKIVEPFLDRRRKEVFNLIL